VAGIVTAGIAIVVDVGAVEIGIGIVAVAAEIVTANRANHASTRALFCRITTLQSFFPVNQFPSIAV
jgi:hypothetical protein